MGKNNKTSAMRPRGQAPAPNHQKFINKTKRVPSSVKAVFEEEAEEAVNLKRLKKLNITEENGRYFLVDGTQVNADGTPIDAENGSDIEEEDGKDVSNLIDDQDDQDDQQGDDSSDNAQDDPQKPPNAESTEELINRLVREKLAQIQAHNVAPTKDFSKKCQQCTTIVNSAPIVGKGAEANKKFTVGFSKGKGNATDKIFASIPCIECQVAILTTIQNEMRQLIKLAKNSVPVVPSYQLQVGQLASLFFASQQCDIRNLCTAKKCTMVGWQVLSTGETCLRVQFYNVGGSSYDSANNIKHHFVWDKITHKWGNSQGIPATSQGLDNYKVALKALGYQPATFDLSQRIAKALGSKFVPPTAVMKVSPETLSQISPNEMTF